MNKKCCVCNNGSTSDWDVENFYCSKHEEMMMIFSESKEWIRQIIECERRIEEYISSIKRISTKILEKEMIFGLNRSSKYSNEKLQAKMVDVFEQKIKQIYLDMATKPTARPSKFPKK